MDTISELIYIIGQRSVKQLDLKIPNGSKLRTLYDSVKNKTVLNDDEASQLIYKEDASSKSYLMLKKNLKDKLFELLWSSEEESTHILNFKFELRRKLYLTEIMLAANVFHNAEKTLIKTIQEAKENELLDVLIDALKQMRYLYFLKGDDKKYKKYNDEYLIAQHQAIQVEKAQAIWENIECKIKYVLQMDKEVMKLTYEGLKEIGDNMESNPYKALKIYHIKLNMLIYKYEREYAKAIYALGTLTSLLKEYPHIELHISEFEILFNKAWFFRSMGKLDESLDCLNNLLSMSSYEAFTRYDVQALHVDVLLKLSMVDKAYQAVTEVKNSHQFEYLHATDQAHWKILSGYVYLASILVYQKVGDDPFQIFNKKNALLVLELECRPIMKDKLGYNLRFIVLKLLLLIIQSNYKLDWDASFVTTYVHRYVSKSPEKRTLHFLRIFMKVVGLHLGDSINQHTKKLYKKIDKHEKYAYDICELLPYPFIIKILLALAEQSKRGAAN